MNNLSAAQTSEQSRSLSLTVVPVSYTHLNVKEQIAAITSKLWTLSKEVGLFDDIAERSKVIEANLETVRVYEEKQERKEQNRYDKRR